MQCHPQPSVLWDKNGYQLESSNKHILEYRNGVCRLTIPQAYPGKLFFLIYFLFVENFYVDFFFNFLDDAGTYSCSATNPLGRATTTGSLDVTGKYNAAHRF